MFLNTSYCKIGRNLGGGRENKGKNKVIFNFNTNNNDIIPSVSRPKVINSTQPLINRPFQPILNLTNHHKSRERNSMEFPTPPFPSLHYYILVQLIATSPPVSSSSPFEPIKPNRARSMRI